MKTMTEMVLDVQRGTAQVDTVVEAISRLVYRYPAGKPGFTDEDGAEFLLRFYPRIRRLVRRYRQTGSSFEGYLQTSMRWQLRSLAIERTSARIRLATVTDRNMSYEILGSDPAAKPSAPDVDLPSDLSAGLAEREPAPYSPPRPKPAEQEPPRPPYRPCALNLRPGGATGDRLTPGEAQRLLCTMLKTGDRLDTELRGRIARVVGCDDRWLEDRWLELREETAALRSRQARFRSKRDRAWFRIRCIEAKLLDATDSERAQLLEERSRWWARYTRARADLERTALGPTHEQIGTVLGIAKGTVDSSIYKARGELLDPGYQARLARLFDAT